MHADSFRMFDHILADEVYGGICTDAYYETAIAYMRARYPQAVFYVFSDEIKWAKIWLESRYLKPGEEELDDNICLIEETNEHTGFLDMMLMTKCKHHIIANSSFSWWAAYLSSNAEKTIIAPQKWNNKFECIDIFTENMIKVSAKGLVV
jgi:hypothetical protein